MDKDSLEPSPIPIMTYVIHFNTIGGTEADRDFQMMHDSQGVNRA